MLRAVSTVKEQKSLNTVGELWRPGDWCGEGAMESRREVGGQSKCLGEKATQHTGVGQPADQAVYLAGWATGTPL